MSVTLSSLEKSFGKKRLFFIDELNLPEGFTCLMGPSGCGKTTLGRVIAGLERADGGRVSGIEGHPTVLFQESRLLPAISAYDNVKCICGSRVLKTFSDELLIMLGFEKDDLDKLPSELSGGMERRVAIARAIVFALENGGNFVLLDEPFSGLDDETKKIAAEVIKTYLSGKTVLVITHDENDCASLGGKIINFSDFSKDL